MRRCRGTTACYIFCVSCSGCKFGRKSEKLDPDQFALALEDVEQAIASSEAADDKQNKAAAAARAEKRRANRGALPAHLPRIHVTIEPEDRNCPCCCSPMHATGADLSERLDVIPAQFRVIVTRRPKYACRACEQAVAQAPAPERLIKGALAITGFSVCCFPTKIEHASAGWTRAVAIVETWSTRILFGCRTLSGAYWSPWPPASRSPIVFRPPIKQERFSLRFEHQSTARLTRGNQCRTGSSKRNAGRTIDCSFARLGFVRATTLSP